MILINYQRNKGFTLVEMMIAMSISLILLLGVSQIFTSNKRSSRVSEGLSRVQENARFALKKMSTDMRKAGYSGCSGEDLKNHLDPTGTGYDEDLFDFTKATAGWDYNNNAATSPTEPGQTFTISTLTPGGTAGAADKWENNDTDGLPTTLIGKVVPGSDIVVLKWMSDRLDGIQLNGNVNPNSAQMGTVSAHGFSKGTVLVVSDCTAGDVFQTVSAPTSKSLQRSGAQQDPGNVNPGSTNWSHAYPAGAFISTFISRAYYIGEGASGEPSLYSITYTQGATGQVTEEVAQGIENMQILYGLDTNADNLPEKYVTAKQVNDHANVVSLKVGLIARSPSEVKTIEATSSKTLLGTTIDIPADRKLRFTFTSMVKIRNKGIK